MYKKIYDPIHGYMNIDNNLLKIIDNPYFKRMKYIKQLGTCYEVFPGASHNRFEHSIGVYHLTNKMLNNIINNNKILLSNKHQRLIEIAALCHDLGHGPYSHVFDNEILKNSHSEYKHHEKRSCLIMENMIKDIKFSKLKINGYDIDFIKSIIHPDKYHDNYLYQIVSNNVNGIDTDKFDYIQRDIHNIGLKYGCDYNRIIDDCRIINNNICYMDKLKYQIFDMFYTRYKLHKEVYNHPVVKSIEYMVKDILLDLNEHINFINNIDSVEFTKYRDDIIFKVYDIKNESINKSRELLNNIHTRNIYKYIGEIKYSNEITKEYLEDTLIDNDIKNDDFIIQDMSLSYLSGNKNPIKNIQFYNKHNVYKSYYLHEDNITKIMPKEFNERTLRLFSKNNENNEKLYNIFSEI